MPTPDDLSAVDLGRRHFARNLLGVWGLFKESLDGTQQVSLRDLNKVPDEVLAEMVPVFREGETFDVREIGLYRTDVQGNDECLYTFGSHEKLMVDQYNCGRNLQTISDQAARQTDMSEQQAFEVAKGLFIRLCGEGWCHPAASHLPGETGE